MVTDEPWHWCPFSCSVVFCLHPIILYSNSEWGSYQSIAKICTGHHSPMSRHTSAYITCRKSYSAMIGPVHHMKKHEWLLIASDPYLAFSPIITHEPWSPLGRGFYMSDISICMFVKYAPCCKRLSYSLPS